MHRKLNRQEQKYLIQVHKKERNAEKRDRIKAVLACDDGYSYSEIARILLLDDETIRRHINDYFSKNKLSPENGGSQSQLNQKQASQLKQHLQKYTHRFVKEICA